MRLSDTGTNLPLAVLGWVSLSAYCALYTGLFLLTVAYLFPLPPKEEEEAVGRSLWAIRFILGAPVLWVGFEYLRSTLATGFPWNALGISQYENLPMIQIASWGGVYAVSASIVVMNAAVSLAIPFENLASAIKPFMLYIDCDPS